MFRTSIIWQIDSSSFIICIATDIFMVNENEELAALKRKASSLPHSRIIRELTKYQSELQFVEKEILRMNSKAFAKDRSKSEMERNRLKHKIIILEEELTRRKTQIS